MLLLEEAAAGDSSLEQLQQEVQARCRVAVGAARSGAGVEAVGATGCGEAAWKAFGADPNWKKAFADSRKDGALVKKVDSVFLSATDYSPIQ